MEEIKAAIPEWPMRWTAKVRDILIASVALGQKQLGKMRDALKSRSTTAREE